MDAATTAVDRRHLLASIGIFRDLGDKEIDRLLELTTTKKLKPKEALFRKGDPGVQLYGVLRGRLTVSSSGADGKEVVFGIMNPGEVVGEIALLDSNERSASVVALEDCDLLSLHRRDLNPFLEQNPRVAVHLAEVLAARLRRLSELMEDTLFRNLPSRLAKKLLSLADSYGSKTPDGVKIDLRLPQQQLGDLVGTSRESINKQLRAWVDEGFVSVDHGLITLRDQEALDSIARFLTL